MLNTEREEKFEEKAFKTQNNKKLMSYTKNMSEACHLVTMWRLKPEVQLKKVRDRADIWRRSVHKRQEHQTPQHPVFFPQLVLRSENLLSVYRLDL